MLNFLQAPYFVGFEVQATSVVSGKDMFILAHLGESDAEGCEKWKINSTLARRLPLLFAQSDSYLAGLMAWWFTADPFPATEGFCSAQR
jgi:hypothetical protein